MSDESNTFWLIVVAIVVFAVCRGFSYWCDCQIQKAREQTQATYWKSLAEMLEKQCQAKQKLIKMLQQ